MKYIKLLLIIVLIIFPNLWSQGYAMSYEKESVLDTVSYQPYERFTLGMVKEKIACGINSIPCSTQREELKRYITTRFNRLYSLGYTEDTVLFEVKEELFSLNPLDKPYSTLQDDLWRFPFIGMLLKSLHFNFLCNMTVKMNIGWITIQNSSLPSEYDIVVIRRATVTSENVLIHSLPGDTIIEKLINWVIDKGVSKFVTPNQGGIRRITLILGSYEKGTIQDPDIPFMGPGPINDFLVDKLASVGLHSYHLQTDAFFTLSL